MFRIFRFAKLVGWLANKSTYFGWLLFAGVMSLLMSISPIGFYITALTMGLAIFISPVPTLFLYLLCFAPTKLFERQKALGLALSFALFGIVAIGVPIYINKNIAAKNVAKMTSDFSKISEYNKQYIEGLEIQMSGFGRPYREHLSFEKGPCAQICEFLLNSGSVKWVRVVYHYKEPSLRQKAATHIRTYVEGKSNNCISANKIQAGCVETIANTKEPADLSMHIKTIDQVSKSKTVRIYNRKGSEIHKQTQINSGRVIIPMILISIPVPESVGLTVAPLPMPKVQNKIDLAQIMRKFGMLLDGYDQIKKPSSLLEVIKSQQEYIPYPTKEETNQIRAILSLDKNSSFTREQHRIISSWLGKARDFPVWDDENLTIIETVLNQPNRLNPGSLNYLRQNLRNRDVIFAILPNTLEQARGNKNIEGNKIVFKALKKHNPSDIAPYKSSLSAVKNYFPNTYPDLEWQWIR